MVDLIVTGMPARKVTRDTVLVPPDAPDVVALSGGRTSAKMLRILLDLGMKPIVLFANTGKERDETLDFVHEIETRWDVDVCWLEYCRLPTEAELVAKLKTKRMQTYALNQEGMHWFRRVTYETAARHSDERTPFDELLEWMSVLPNPRSRACTAQLKMRTMQRYLWSEGIHQFRNYIGIRADEVDRAIDMIHSKARDNDAELHFPLAELGITETDVMGWWGRQPFDLQLQSYEGNCHLCFFKKRKVKQRLIREQPQLTAWWKEWENKKKLDCYGDGARWRAEKGHAISDLEFEANHPQIFRLEDDGVDAGAFDCSCTSGFSLASSAGDE